MIHAITADGTPAKKSDEILAYRLACGHTVGGEQYEEFQAESRKIEIAAYNAITAARDEAAAKKAALWKSLTTKAQEA
jgi:hypothetical protein